MNNNERVEEVLENAGHCALVIRKVLGSKYEGETNDVLQNAIIKAWRGLGRFENRNRSTLKTWMHRIAFNEAISHERKEKRYKIVYLEDLPPEEKEMSDPTLNPETLLIEQRTKNEICSRVEEAIEKLSPRARTAILLHYFNEKKIREVAEEMMITKGGVGSNLQQARKNLRKSLKL